MRFLHNLISTLVNKHIFKNIKAYSSCRPMGQSTAQINMLFFLKMLQIRAQTSRMNLWFAAGRTEGGDRAGIVTAFGRDMYILLQLKRITNQDLLQNTGNSAQCRVAPWMGGGLGGEWIHVMYG